RPPEEHLQGQDVDVLHRDEEHQEVSEEAHLSLLPRKALRLQMTEIRISTSSQIRSWLAPALAASRMPFIAAIRNRASCRRSRAAPISPSAAARSSARANESSRPSRLPRTTFADSSSR